VAEGWESTGVDGVDVALGGGLLTGDNIVWFGGDDELHRALGRAFFAAAPSGTTKTVVTTREAPAAVRRAVGEDVDVLDARPGRRFADPLDLERAVVERGTTGSRVAIDGLDDFVHRLGPARSLALFSRICPQLFDAGAICSWRAGESSRPIRDKVRSVTQCVLDVSRSRLRVVKAEGRTGVQGRLFQLELVDGSVSVQEERTLGRLAEGLRRLRAERGLTQSDVARVAGVSPSAISQAEAGHRGLGLETVMRIAEGVGTTIDDLLGASAPPGYVIARRDRGVPRGDITPLLDDPGGGLRAYLVQLEPGARGEPPAVHKGPELIVVASGLVQVELGTETPVMRAGDAVLATTVGVRGWRNLLAAPARLFWILSDPSPRAS
jgi:transcriptional regulator with XRE-family HTH domain